MPNQSTARWSRLWLLVIPVAIIAIGVGITGYHPLAGNIDEKRFLLDTVISIKIFQSSDEALMEKAFEKITAFEEMLSRYHPESEISRINNAGYPVKISSSTIHILKIAIKYAAISAGAFDPTIGPIVDIWGIGTDNPRIPGDQEIAQALPLVDYKEIRLDIENGEATLNQPGALLDLGGITKGWIADEIATYLKANGAQHIIINLGGNVRIVGGKPGGEKFRIGMQDPFGERGSYLGRFTMDEGSIVSSGVYERYFEADGVRYHHILDTKTGYPVDNGLAAVTVISDFSIDGDALSTALFALGLEAGLKQVIKLKPIEAAFITTQGEIFMTPGAATIFEPMKEGLSIHIYPNQ